MIRVVTVCRECGKHYDTRQPGEVCQALTRTDMGLPCHGEIHVADAGLVQLLGEVLIGVHGRRSRSDIMTDIAGSRSEVTGEVRAFVHAACDLLGYLPSQKGD